MGTLLDRPRPAGCYAPILIDPVVGDPGHIRELARLSGPYFQPGRYLVGSGAAADAAKTSKKRAAEAAPFVGPVFRGDWATRGAPRIDGAMELLHLDAFVEAAGSMTGGDVIVPEQVYVNLTAPVGGQAFSHTDIPEFVGIDRTNAPAWLLTAMHASGWFDDHRITTITAVAWFHSGERGFFRYWPEGREAESRRHENMWNTAVVGDNDLMHHKVERSGPADRGVAPGMSIDTELLHDGNEWVVAEGDREFGRFTDDEIRLSLSWKAKVYADDEARQRADAGEGAPSIAEVLARFRTELADPDFATGDDPLSDPAVRKLLSERFTTYVPG